MGFKKVLTKRTIVWGATSIFLLGVVVAANVVMRGEVKDILYSALGRRRPILAENDGGVDFGQTFTTKEEALANGDAVTEKICDEGMILLKNENNALPLKAKAKVSVFGKNSVNLVYGGTGSAAPDGGERKSIFDSLTAAGLEYNKTLKNFYEDNSKSGKGRVDDGSMKDGEAEFKTWPTGETAISAYSSDITSSYDEYSDAALVVFSRTAGESKDLPRFADDDSSRHYLELDNNERALLKHIVDSGKFQHIVVLMNGSNYIDLGFLKNDMDGIPANKLDACINIGSPGCNGIMALGRILTGAVNPSGHTVDLVYTNYRNDPTFQNFGGNLDASKDFYYAPNGVNTLDYHMVEYEENIYMGYRYYETRYATMAKTDAAAANIWYNQNVLYPFGFGLSYTSFSEEIVNKADLDGSSLNTSEPFKITVKVTNTGEVAGKQVVQVYAEAPYYDGKIEKAHKVLAGFAKTSKLEKGASENIEIEVNPYYFASFDNHDANGDGFRGYTLDAGNYVFHVATDSHNDIDTFTKTLATTANIDKDPVTQTKVEPLFDNVSGIKEDSEHPGTWIKDDTIGMKSIMTRTDWEGTFPTTATIADRTVTSALKAKLDSIDSGNKDDYSSATMPKMGEIGDVVMPLKELVGLEYNDPKWETFLNQLTFQDMIDLFNKGCYSTTPITRKIDGEEIVLVPGTTSCDGPTGMVTFMGKSEVYQTCYYCSECLVAQTYNLELAKEQAEAIGQESLVGNLETGLSYPGWYAPGVNLHRSPFSGRNTEYYSEDPLLCGKFAATVIAGVQSRGVYANVKHFALNDQETNRSAKGIATWCDEQAMRELYLRPFEIAVKEGKTKGLMTSFNRVGTTWAGGDYRLVTTVLRKEWGFVGSVICDFHTSANDYMDSKQMLYAGGDLNLAGQETVYLKEGSGDIDVSSSNKKDVILLRNASHNLLYCIANSNAMKAEVIGYRLAVWEILLTVGTVVVCVGIAGWGTWAILTSLRKKDDVVAEAN